MKLRKTNLTTEVINESETMSDIVEPKRKRIKKEIPVAPPIKNLSDLLVISKTTTKYSNIDIKKLNDISDDLDKLNSMIGMKHLKEDVFRQILYVLQNLHEDQNGERDYLNTVIYGAPGSGKTEVAKIIGGLYSNLGLFTDGFRTLTRSDLIGEYLGQTTIKTMEALEDCLGCTVLIDEVYSLASPEKRDSFSKECIDTINLFLSEHKSEICMIIVGYEEDVDKCFFSMNSGLKRRFPIVYKVDKYSDTDLLNIFKKKVNDVKWVLDCQDTDLLKIFKDEKELFEFKGGSVENLIAKIKLHHSTRVFGLNVSEKKRITIVDVREAIKDIHSVKPNIVDNFKHLYL
jgi:SpoVK/Ycf46/Vps4 family AAA+-type ATPase